jgi:hypothetical protein
MVHDGRVRKIYAYLFVAAAVLLLAVISTYGQPASQPRSRVVIGTIVAADNVPTRAPAPPAAIDNSPPTSGAPVEIAIVASIAALLIIGTVLLVRRRGRRQA